MASARYVKHGRTGIDPEPLPIGRAPALVDHPTRPADPVARLIVLGFDLGLLVPAMTSALLGSVDTSRSGVASGA